MIIIAQAMRQQIKNMCWNAICWCWEILVDSQKFNAAHKLHTAS